MAFPKNESYNRVVKITQIPSTQKDFVSSQKPVKFMGNINSVLGKTLKENLFGLNNEIIAKKIINENVFEQEKIDNIMIKLDGTKNKSRLGANAILRSFNGYCKCSCR